MNQKHLVVAALCAGIGAATSSAHAQQAPAGALPPPPPAPPPPAAEAPRPAAPPEGGGDHLAPNAVYAEGLGAGLAYSFNYERIVTDDLGVRIGFGYLSYGASVSGPGGTASASSTLITIPVTASYLGVRSGKHALELGGGATIASASGGGSAFGYNGSGSAVVPFGILMVGYRIHPVDHAGFHFRVGAMSIIGKGVSLSSNADTADKIGMMPWGYISMGGAF